MMNARKSFVYVCDLVEFQHKNFMDKSFVKGEHNHGERNQKHQKQH